MLSMRTIGEFLDLVESHKDHMWFISKGAGSGWNGMYGWGQISLGGFEGLTFPQTIAALETLRHPIEKQYRSTVEVLEITIGLYRVVRIASEFRVKKLRNLEGLTCSSEKLIALRGKLISILNPLEQGG